MAGVTLAHPVPWAEQNQEQRGREREWDADEEREHGRARIHQREEDEEMPGQDDDGDELAAFQAAEAARGALQGDRQGGAIEGFVQAKAARSPYSSRPRRMRASSTRTAATARTCST